MKKKKKKTLQSHSKGEAVVTLPAETQSKGSFLAFQDISYFVPDSSNKAKDLQLLHKVSGYVEPGKILALMGNSSFSFMLYSLNSIIRSLWSG